MSANSRGVFIDIANTSSSSSALWAFQLWANIKYGPFELSRDEKKTKKWAVFEMSLNFAQLFSLFIFLTDLPYSLIYLFIFLNIFKHQATPSNFVPISFKMPKILERPRSAVFSVDSHTSGQTGLGTIKLLTRSCCVVVS